MGPCRVLECAERVRWFSQLDRQQLRIDISPKLVLADVSSAPTRRDRVLWTKDTDSACTSIALRSSCGGSKSSNCHWNRKSPSQSLLQFVLVPYVHHRISLALSLVPEMEVIPATCSPGYLNMSFLPRSQMEATEKCLMRTSSFEESRGNCCMISTTIRELNEVTRGVGRGQEWRWNTDLGLSHSMWETLDCSYQVI